MILCLQCKPNETVTAGLPIFMVSSELIDLGGIQHYSFNQLCSRSCGAMLAECSCYSVIMNILCEEHVTGWKQ